MSVLLTGHNCDGYSVMGILVRWPGSYLFGWRNGYFGQTTGAEPACPTLRPAAPPDRPAARAAAATADPTANHAAGLTGPVANRASARPNRPMALASFRKTCWRCGAAFGCGAAGAGPCWCADLPAVTPSADGSDCLCPECLHAVAQARPPAVSDAR